MNAVHIPWVRQAALATMCLSTRLLLETMCVNVCGWVCGITSTHPTLMEQNTGTIFG